MREHLQAMKRKTQHMEFLDRDLSWLSFNERVLQEAEDPSVALGDRLNFLAIFSSNLEEFYKVRIAALRFALRYKGDKKNKFGYKPSYLLNAISEIVEEQQIRLGNIFRNQLLPEFEAKGVKLLNLEEVTDSEVEKARALFDAHFGDSIEVMNLDSDDHLELENQRVYLYWTDGHHRAISALDYSVLGRFVEIGNTNGVQRILQLDDIFRLNADKFLPGNFQAYAIKISRDADLYLENEDSADFVEKIRKSIKKRESGLPARLLFDETIPFKEINALRKKVGVDLSGMIPGGSYHNFYDFFSFPRPAEDGAGKSTVLPVPEFSAASDWFSVVKRQDVCFSFPYQSFDAVVEFLQRACEDPQVREINVTLYRVASNSAICAALETAALAGKKVFVLDEVQARFDEENNIFWGDRLQKAGATVSYGIPDKKVHAKLFSIIREEEGALVQYNYLGTGNLNEKSSRIYADHGLLTANASIGADIRKVFQYLSGHADTIDADTLLVAPFSLRSSLLEKIDREIAHAEAGQLASIQLKLNSLEDPEMIAALRKAADKGVKVDMVVRGINCFTPLSPSQEKNIRVVSILGKFLEHTRIYHFRNGGHRETYLASADWMTRNLSRRVEVAYPVFNPQFEQLLLDEIAIQLKDSLKGRLPLEGNRYIEGNESESSQTKMYALVEASLPKAIGVLE